MATTRIAAQVLEVGEVASATAWTPNESTSLTATCVEVVATSQVRLVVKDANGLVIASTIILSSNSKGVFLAALDGAISVSLECLQGSAQVTLTEATGGAIDTASLADLAVTTGKLALLAVDTPQIAAGALDLTAPGLAIIADDYFDTAAFAAGAGGKFAADCLQPASVLNIFEADSCDGPACANMFLNGAIPVAKVAAAPFSLETAIADPGAAANIVVTSSGTCSLTIAAPADNRGLPIPAAEGLVMVITHFAGANAGTVTSAQALDIQGTTVLNFVAELGQWVMLVAVSNGTALRWRIVAQGGLAVTTETPVYVPLVFANVLTGAAIPVTASGRIALTTAGGGENRTLAIPTFEGQRLTIESVAANAAHTVTCAAAFDPLGAVVLYFKGGVNEQITLEARMVVAGLVWRVAVDEDLVSHYIPDVGTGNAIPVTRMHTIMPITTAGGGPETNTLAIPARLGQTMCLVDDVQGVNDRTITVTGDMDSAGNDLITPTAAGQAISLKAVQVAGALVWRLVGNDGCTLA